MSIPPEEHTLTVQLLSSLKWYSLTVSWRMFRQRAVSQCLAGPSSLRPGPLGCASCELPREGSSPCRCGHRGSAGAAGLESLCVVHVGVQERGREGRIYVMNSTYIDNCNLENRPTLGMFLREVSQLAKICPPHYKHSGQTVYTTILIHCSH